MDSDGNATAPVGDLFGARAVGRFHLAVAEGPAVGKSWVSSGDHCSIGSEPSNDLVIEDPTVSRFHCEIRIDARGLRVRDLESKNGTIVDGVQVVEAFLHSGSVLTLGRTRIQLELAGERVALPLSKKTQLGSLVGASVAMRKSFALLERAAASDATVLLEGETGTGKEGAAEAIHQLSARRDGPFVVIDCAAIPPNLLESHLFGHERGAFTGASERHVGAFEEASSGTVFLDEIGEMPVDLQPKLLRVLERREIRRVGGGKPIPVDVRVVAATHRDLRTGVNQGAFRADLYYRLAVVRIGLPPLRSRLEDLPLLVERFLETLGADAATAASLRTPETMAHLASCAWPGNVRELRNYLERCVVFQQPLPLADAAGDLPPVDVWDYAEAKQRALAAFERRFVERLLARHQGKVAAAAAEAGVSDVYLYRLLKRHREPPG
jgi:transcriptional regulator with PAS, ATPase and Fis domain